MSTTSLGVEALDSDQSGALQQQSDLVLDSFRNLFAKCDTLTDGPQCAGPKSIRDAAYIDQLKLTTSRLDSDLLPLLGDQLSAISRMLDPSDLRKEPISELKRILAIQVQLDHTMDQIISALETLPEQDIVPNQTTDQHDKALKYYRLNGLDQCIRQELLMEMAGLFSSSILLVRRLGFSASSEEMTASETVARAGKDVISAQIRSESSLESAITWLRGSEWETVLVGWQIGMEVIDSILESNLCAMNSIPRKQGDNQRRRVPLSERNIQLGTLFIPILKLARIFLKKLSTLGTSRKPLPHFTEMCTHQLQSLHDLPVCLIARLGSLQTMSTGTEVFDEASITRFNNVARKLLALLQSALLDVVLSVVPLVPDTNGSQIHSYLRAWFVTWNNQFIVATQNVTRQTLSFLNNPQ